jgi:hypothetical protein
VTSKGFLSADYLTPLQITQTTQLDIDESGRGLI